MYTDAPQVRDIIMPTDSIGFIDMDWFAENIGSFTNAGTVDKRYRGAFQYWKVFINVQFIVTFF